MPRRNKKNGGNQKNGGNDESVALERDTFMAEEQGHEHGRLGYDGYMIAAGVVGG